MRLLLADFIIVTASSRVSPNLKKNVVFSFYEPMIWNKLSESRSTENLSITENYC